MIALIHRDIITAFPMHKASMSAESPAVHRGRFNELTLQQLSDLPPNMSYESIKHHINLETERANLATSLRLQRHDAKLARIQEAAIKGAEDKVGKHLTQTEKEHVGRRALDEFLEKGQMSHSKSISQVQLRTLANASHLERLLKEHKAAFNQDYPHHPGPYEADLEQVQRIKDIANWTPQS